MTIVPARIWSKVRASIERAGRYALEGCDLATFHLEADGPKRIMSEAGEVVYESGYEILMTAEEAK